MVAAMSGAYSPPPPGSRLRFDLPKYGDPIQHFIYRNQDGSEAVHVTRYNPPKDAPSAADDGLVTRYASAFSEWKISAKVPTPIIFYHLDKLGKGSERVLVVDNEDDADWLNGQQPDGLGEADIVTTWLGGAACVKKAELRPLMTRRVVLVPRNIETSLKSMGYLGAQLHQAGAEVSYLDVRKAGLAAGWTVRQTTVDGLDELISLHAVGITLAPPPQPKTQSVSVLAQAGYPGGDDSIPLVERWAVWRFQRAPSGKPFENLTNVQRYLENHPGEYGDVWMDIYRKQIRYTDDSDGFEHEWQDEDDIELQGVLQRNAGLYNVHKTVVRDAVISHAFKRPRHPYREWLKSLDWDGVERLDVSLVHGWGTPDDDYHRACGRCLFLQQAARILKPGCKADLMFIMEGETGTHKSHSLAVMFGDDNVVVPKSRFGHKDFYQEILGKTVVEIADLGNFRGAELEIIKRDVTTTTDRFRPPYGRIPSEFPRQCVFIGTTEVSDWNEDPMLTARRFPPLECGRIDLQWIEANRLQILAEARVRIERGEPWFGMIPEQQARDKQIARAKHDSWEEAVIPFLQSRNRVTVADILSGPLQIEDKSKWSPATATRVGKILRKQGWIPCRNSTDRWWENRSAVIQPRLNDF